MPRPQRPEATSTTACHPGPFALAAAMIHVVLPTQYSSRNGARFAEPHKRLMAAVLRAVVDDCRSGSTYRASADGGPVPTRSVRRAIAYVASTDRVWPFSFENLCEALDLDAGDLRAELDLTRAPA